MGAENMKQYQYLDDIKSIHNRGRTLNVLYVSLNQLLWTALVYVHASFWEH